jgi:hypothetical protein
MSITANNERIALLDRVIAFSGFTASWGFRGPLSTRRVRFPLADPQKTPDWRAQIWSRQHDREEEFHKKDQDYQSHV